MQAKLSETKRSGITNINRELSPHIIQVILSKLSVVSLPACRIVCKAWNNLVLDYASTRKFVRNTFILCTRDIFYSHLKFDSPPLCLRKPKIHCFDFNVKHSRGRRMSTFASSFGFEDNLSNVRIVNSCNGFLFVFKLTHDSGTACAGILNPMTNEFIELPIGDDDQEMYGYGFGFSPKTECYKLARVSKSCSTFEILTFGGIGSNQWRYVHELCYVVICDNGVYFNGALYWIGRDWEENDEDEDEDDNEHQYVICRLDIENERIEETISLVEIGPPREASIGVVNGCLYAAFFLMDSPYTIQVWKMRKIGGGESWSRAFVIDDIPNDWALEQRRTVDFQMIKVTGNGNFFCLVNDDCFFMYDPKNRKMKKIWMKPSNENESGRRDFLWVCQMENLNFSSLQKILTADDC